MYALVKDNEIQNVIECNQAFADSIADQWDEVIPSNGMGKGWKKVAGVWTAPEQPSPAPETVAPWTKKEFLLKFTPAEYAAISAATKTNALLDYYWQLFMVAENVLKTDPATIDGINALESDGLLAAGRAAEILA